MKTLRQNPEARVSLDFVPPHGPFQVTTRAADGRIIFREKRVSKRQAEALYSKALSAQKKAI